ncbi:hypothetical protein GCM10020254_30980 [Streptomyces goshikiensis]
MLLSGDPQAALDERRLAAREGARQAALLARLAKGERQTGRLAAAARKARDTKAELVGEMRERKEEVGRQLKEVERTLAALTPGELAQLDAREAADTADAQRELLRSGALGSPPYPYAHGRGRRRADLRHRPDRQTVRLGRRGAGVLRLLRPHLAGVGARRPVHSPDQPGAVGTAAPGAAGPAAARGPGGLLPEGHARGALHRGGQGDPGAPAGNEGQGLADRREPAPRRRPPRLRRHPLTRFTPPPLPEPDPSDPAAGDDTGYSAEEAPG